MHFDTTKVTEAHRVAFSFYQIVLWAEIPRLKITQGFDGPACDVLVCILGQKDRRPSNTCLLLRVSDVSFTSWLN